MKDYIVVKFEMYNFQEIFLYDHELTNEEIKKVQEALNNYNGEDETIEDVINNVLPYIDYIILDDDDDYHTIWY